MKSNRFALVMTLLLAAFFVFGLADCSSTGSSGQSSSSSSSGGGGGY